MKSRLRGIYGVLNVDTLLPYYLLSRLSIEDKGLHLSGELVKGRL